MKKLKFLLILFWSGSAFAYLDPGTGSMIIQSVIAALAGAAYAIKLYWTQLKVWFFSLKKKEDKGKRGND